MTERGPSPLRPGALAALVALSACTLDAHATGSRVPDASDRRDASLAPSPEDAAASDGAGSHDAGTSQDASAVDAGHDETAPLDGGDDAGLVEGPLGDGGYPALLSQTGLYQSLAADAVSDGVMAYQPRFALWTDGAVKRRWLQLPGGTQIDTSDMDAWNFPVGTKAWKEFALGDLRVETRLLHKVGKEEWVMVAYRWREDQSEADALPMGEVDALGTPHDVPGQPLCTRCHNRRGVLLGVSALQLSHALGGLNLDQLKAAGRLSHPPEGAFQIPGGTLAENALGYLHANCGHCHRPGTATHAQLLERAPKTGGPILWERTDALDSLEQTVGYQSTVLRPNGVLPNLHIIEPGAPEESELIVRASQRGVGTLQMPPLGTEVVDQVGLAQLKAWIRSLER